MIIMVLFIALTMILVTASIPGGTINHPLAMLDVVQSGPLPANCESNSSTLSSTSQAAQAAGPDGLIIAIARLGNGEHRRGLNLRRLHNVRIFLTDFAKRPVETVITAEGKPTTGFGRVELYVSGKLFDVIAVNKNGDLLVTLTCEPDEIRPRWADRNLYPYLDRKPRKPATKP
jgi:hypothetical protein